MYKEYGNTLLPEKIAEGYDSIFENEDQNCERTFAIVLFSVLLGCAHGSASGRRLVEYWA